MYVWFPSVWFAPLAFVPRILALHAAWKHPSSARVYRVKIATSILAMIVIGLLIWFALPYLA